MGHNALPSFCSSGCPRRVRWLFSPSRPPGILYILCHSRMYCISSLGLRGCGARHCQSPWLSESWCMCALGFHAVKDASNCLQFEGSTVHEILDVRAHERKSLIYVYGFWSLEIRSSVGSYDVTIEHLCSMISTSTFLVPYKSFFRKKDNSFFTRQQAA